MEEKKYKAVYVAKKNHKHFDKGDIVAVSRHEIVDAPAELIKYNRLAIFVEVDIFRKEDNKLVRYNGLKQYHNTSMFADLMLSFDKLTNEEIKEFYHTEKVFQNVIQES